MIGKTKKNLIIKANKNKVIAVLFTLILVLLIFISVEAKEPQFELNIDDTSLEKGVSANLVLSVENAQGAELIEIQGLSNFDVLNQGQSSSTQIINGNISRLDRYNYIIMPVKEGEYSLQGVVKYRGKEYKTNRLSLTVKKGSSLAGDEVNNLFIKSIIDRRKIYFGENFILGYELYSRYNIENYGFSEQLDLTGFISQEIPGNELKAEYQQLNGKKYVKYEVKKLILTPTSVGSYTIPGSNFQVNVSTSNFFDFSKPFYLQTEPVKLEVKGLPLSNQPDKFSGLVGELEVESSYNKREIEYGDPLTLKVKLSGSCNLDNLEKIMPDSIPGISIYETEKNRQEEIQNGRYFASREFEIIIVPDRIGEIKIPAVEIPYFNPLSEEYESVMIEGTEIQVNGEMEAFNQTTEINQTLEPKETVRIEQVNYAPANNDYLLIQIKRTHLRTALYILVIVIVLALIIFLSYRYWRKTDDRLRELFKKVKKENDETELFNLLNEMIKYRFDLSLKAVSRERLKSEIKDKEILDNLLQFMDYVENNRYLQKGKSVDLKCKIKMIYQKIC